MGENVPEISKINIEKSRKFQRCSKYELLANIFQYTHLDDRNTASKKKFSTKDFFSTCTHLLKMSFVLNFILSAVQIAFSIISDNKDKTTKSIIFFIGRLFFFLTVAKFFNFKESDNWPASKDLLKQPSSFSKVKPLCLRMFSLNIKTACFGVNSILNNSFQFSYFNGHRGNFTSLKKL